MGVETAVLVCSVLSLCGSLFLIFSFLCFEAFRRIPFNFVVLLAISDAIVSVAIISSQYSDSSVVCAVAGVAINFFQIASPLWTSAICFVIFRIVTMDIHRGFEIPSRLLHLLAWGIPLTCTLPVIALHAVYGVQFQRLQTTWCWVGDSHVAVRAMCYYLPIGLAFIFNLGLVVVTIYRVWPTTNKEWSLQSHSEGPLLEDPERATFLLKTGRLRVRLLLVVLAFVGVRVWGLAALLKQEGVVNELDTWSKASTIAFSLQGFINALLYGVNKHLFREYHRALWYPTYSWRGSRRRMHAVPST